MKFSSYYKGCHWPHILFFVSTPLVATAGIIWRLTIGAGGLPGATWILAFVMLVFCGLSTTAGYHRLFAHKTFQARLPVRLFYLFFGAGAFQGSVRWWACEHRYHHLYTDTANDPYGINKGFWHAHIGWLFTKDQEPPDFSNVKDLDQDRWIRWQDRLFPLLALLAGFGLPAAIACLWGDPWGGFFLAGVARLVVNHHTTFCINSVCHYVGKQPYSDTHSARDSWISALLTYGEGYHNFHHTFQTDYRNGIRFFHWDPTKWSIILLHWLGLAGDLRKVREEKILAAKLLMDQTRLSRRLQREPHDIQRRTEEVILATRLHVQNAYLKFQELKKELKVRKEDIRADYLRAKRDFKAAMAEWQALMRKAAYPNFKPVGA